jgi:hypothetical protein
VVLARFVRNQRLAGALQWQAVCALRAYPALAPTTTQLRTRGAGHQAVLRQLSDRLVGILHGCLKTRTTYDGNTAWGHPFHDQQAVA